MDVATSADGTTIAYDRWGSGPVVVIIGGAFNHRQTWTELAQALAGDFTAVSYDRRGRGDSGDASPRAVEREVDDLKAVIDAVGADGSTFAHGVSSGGALLLRALAAGLPIARASVLEPPYRIAGAPPAPDRYIATLERFIEADDRAGIVEYFVTKVVGLPSEMLDPMKDSPMWDAFQAMAPSLVYDGLAVGGDDQSLPPAMLGGIQTPVLAVTSTGTEPHWLSETAGSVAAALPNGRLARLDGGFHEVPSAVLAPALAGFYTKEG